MWACIWVYPIHTCFKPQLTTIQFPYTLTPINLVCNPFPLILKTTQKPWLSRECWYLWDHGNHGTEALPLGHGGFLLHGLDQRALMWRFFSMIKGLFELAKQNLVGGLEHEFCFPYHIWDVILPIDELHYFSRCWNHQPETYGVPVRKDCLEHQPMIREAIVVVDQ